MSNTVFRCSRCGYENEALYAFKKHLARKTECKPKISDIKFEEVKQQYQHLLTIPMERKPESPNAAEKRKRKRRKTRSFGDENMNYIKRETLQEFVSDPLKGIQEIITMVYFNPDREENYTVRSIENEPGVIEVHIDDAWVRKSKRYIFDKMIYLATAIMEYNVAKKNWTPEFTNFITDMGELDNDNMLELIREEVDDTVTNAEKTRTLFSDETA